MKNSPSTPFTNKPIQSQLKSMNLWNMSEIQSLMTAAKEMAPKKEILKKNAQMIKQIEKLKTYSSPGYDYYRKRCCCNEMNILQISSMTTKDT